MSKIQEQWAGLRPRLHCNIGGCNGLGFNREDVPVSVAGAPHGFGYWNLNQLLHHLLVYKHPPAAVRALLKKHEVDALEAFGTDWQSIDSTSELARAMVLA
jgi:hypothetical protein